MSNQASFALRSRNPDVLTCIANLSNDEVFTPPEFAVRMLDGLAEAWAANNGGANIWADPAVRFLDPMTKSGVFLREITSRLTHALKEQIPDLQTRVDHILSKQVFGIGITKLTSLLARRSLYCSKHANGKYSITKSLGSDEGNVWFKRTEHTWVVGKCKYCGANQSDYDRGNKLETHAYAFIHADDIKATVGTFFGGNMQFDVIIGNPPYQLGESGGDSVGSFAMPIYQKFVEAAKSLDPRYVVMVTPSRWFAGGRGLDEYRTTMLGDRRIRALVDFPNAADVFPGVEIKGGVSYFIWDAAWNDACDITTVVNGVAGPTMKRLLDEWDVLVRRNEAVSILRRVLSISKREALGNLATKVSPIQPFSIRTNFRGAASRRGMKRPVLLYENGGTSYVERADIPRHQAWVDEWKVLLSNASGSGNDAQVLSRPIIAPPGSACTETYLVISRFPDEAEAQRFAGYLTTRFVRFLVSLRKYTQHIYSERFQFVPDLPMDREWTDAMLYRKFGITAEERSFIESLVKEMEFQPELALGGDD